MKTAYLIPVGDETIVELDGKVHSLRKLLGVEKVITLSDEDGLALLDRHIENLLDMEDELV